jgi:hypothetical protein
MSMGWRSIGCKHLNEHTKFGVQDMGIPAGRGQLGLVAEVINLLLTFCPLLVWVDRYL